MADSIRMPGSAPRKARVDGQRNRELLIETARASFAAAAAPTQPPVSLEAIARAAGVGIGTLYRHFPTREALVEAVYESEVSEVTTITAHEAALPADLGLREWMNRYAAFVATKRGMLDTLRAGWASGAITTPHTRERVNAVIAHFLERGAGTGALRAGVPADDITTALLGVLMATASAPDQAQIGRLLDLIVCGLRTAP